VGCLSVIAGGLAGLVAGFFAGYLARMQFPGDNAALFGGIFAGALFGGLIGSITGDLNKGSDEGKGTRIILAVMLGGFFGALGGSRFQILGDSLARLQQFF